ncbi:lipopolysaccharide biosynthesis protein [Calidifontimicrobium sp. SYSU G02091]|uniref:lipopolysaccharide biosynthesis protein n=1 Tax=Calidifontimicrobium sp. SYSU G02091 TaxID=2926421 RepID=UPI001F5382EF|nr:lipopolysaccharide biosynthesis protein [Calidifontimicrobium sp. SYSU G02091]MCI1191735.1 lipopolysaccharide biosynthesis protein [Calidifontimicrobium sp. SYSU G02091]
MNLGDSIRSGAKWLLFGSIGNQVIQFAIGVVLARLLTPADFGLIVTVQIFTGLAGLIAGGGMGQALIREKDVERLDFHAVFVAQLLIGAVIYFVFFVTAPLIAKAFGDPVYTDLVRISTLAFLLRPLVNIPSVILRRDMRFKETSIVNVAAGLLTGAVGIALAWLGWGVWSLVISGYVGSLATIAALMWLARYSPKPVLALERARRFAAFGLKFSLNDIVSYARAQSANLVMSREMGPAAVGTYNKADSLVNIPFQTISGSVYEALFRGLSTVQDDLAESKRLYLRSIELLGVYTLPIYIGMAWLAEPFILGIYGPKWADAAIPLAVLALSGIFTCVGHPAGAVLAAQNMLGRELVVQLTFLGTTVLGILIGMHWGVAGIATGIVIARGIAAVHITWLVATRLPLSGWEVVRALRSSIFLSLFMLAAFLLMKYLVLPRFAWSWPLLELALGCLVGGAAYAAAFLTMPIASLSGERARWMQLLRLQRA